jgi:hypothetical protein
LQKIFLPRRTIEIKESEKPMNNTAEARPAFPAAIPDSLALSRKIQKLGCKTVLTYLTFIESIAYSRMAVRNTRAVCQ